MSVDGETSRVMKGVQHGACDYLLKPIRMKELKNIWQHVFRKRIHEVRDIEGQESLEEIQMMRSGMEHLDDGYFFNGDLISGKKRKDVDNKHDDRVCGDPSSVKKARVVWTVDLHQKFVKAVNQIGFEKVGPKKILDLMGVPWLTRENVASHLQKYRLYLTRLQKENELKATLGGTKHPDIPPKENVCLQNSIPQNATSVKQNILANETHAASASGHRILLHNDEPKICDGNMKGILSMPMTDSKKALFGDTNDLSKCSTSRIGFNHSFPPLDSDVKSKPPIRIQYSWSTEVPPLQFKQEPKPHFRSDQRSDHLPLPMQHIDSVESSVPHNPGTSKENDKPISQGIGKVTKIDTTAGLFAPIDLIPCAVLNTKNPNLEQDLFGNLESSQKNLFVGTGSALRLWDEEFNNYSSSQGDFYPPNAYLGNIESFTYGIPELFPDIPPYLYDSFNPNDVVEYPVMDQGLSIV
ncbi:hypothetical protein CDL12_00853 [Handroanthus impetiginosus]|uniref:Response regulatory domain-containing protein n=1 Tax=Handroanthus impetiginosus TaxID=429701 RepID=A0A2G9I9H3_9LAMI|nr:hypothetical protein CDL12_00853 [Handroanthus impetiginosus]